VDTPVGTVLPRKAEDKDEFFLVVDSANHIVHHYRYRAAVAAWEFVGDQRVEVVTALPTTGLYEGLQVVYDTGTAGVRWHFVYDTTDGLTNPWLFIGGPPLTAEVLTNQTTTSTSFAALTTAGPSVTLPLAGTYDVAIGCDLWNSDAGAASLMSYDIGASAAVDADAVLHQEVAADSLSPTTTWRSRRKTGLTAVALTAKYRATAGTGSFQNRSITATPVRVV
jgi:hypothetical protein